MSKKLLLIVAFMSVGGFTIATSAVHAEQASNASGVAATAIVDGVANVGSAYPAAPSYGEEAVPAAEPAKKEKTFADTARKILYAISKHPTGREAKMPNWRIEQDRAVVAAREGRYEQALPVLKRLHNEHPDIPGISIDYATVLAWAGYDADAIAVYKSLPAGERPDYLLDAVGHSYRNLKQPMEALVVYRLGLQSNPENQSFLAGEIFSLLESAHNEEAIASAQSAANKFVAPSPDLESAIKKAFHVNAVELARGGHYKESLELFATLRAKYPDDALIAGDNVAVLSWAGKHNEAVALYRALPAGEQPDYVLDAAAHSYRTLRQPKQALDLYQAAYAKDPSNLTYSIGIIYCLSDLGRNGDALQFAKTVLARHPEKPAELMAAIKTVERAYAIELARAGKYEQSLTMLRQLRAKYPGDQGLAMDYIAVLSWAGKDSEAVAEYQKIARLQMPDFVLEAVAGSYRKLGQSEKALAVFRRGAKQSPANPVFTAGIVRSLDDLNQYDEAVSTAKAFTAKYGEHLDVLLAGGEASNFSDRSVDAMDFYQRANAISPKNAEALRGLVRAQDRAGAPQLALATSAQYPGLISAQDHRTLVGDLHSNMVRWGNLEPADEMSRFRQTDEALMSIDAHINAWVAQNDAESYPDIMRARFDRLIALRNRVRMQDVVEDYRQLADAGVEVPAFALVAVGDAYLYLRQPEAARDVLKKALAASPKDFEARRLLAYSYLESNQYDEAFAAADQLRADQPVWIYLKGEPERQPNPNRAMAEVDAATMRSYAGLQSDADKMLTPIVDAAPFDARNRAAAGNLAMAKGHPREALEHFQIGAAIQEGKDVANETGIVGAQLALQNFRESEAALASLVKRYPENQGVLRAYRDWQIQNMAEVNIRAGFSPSPWQNSAATNNPHGQGYNIGATVYSAPIDYDWRLFAGQDFFHEREPADEGHSDYGRSIAGVEYRRGDVTASLAPTFNAYNKNMRLGAEAKGKYTFNDMWSADIAVALFSGETPLRALAAGVTSNKYDVRVVWRQDDERSLTLGASLQTFSDNNVRTAQTADYVETVFKTPTLRVEAEGTLALSQNGKDENRLYFNPKSDVMALVGARVTHTLYHRYDTLYEHSLLAMPGVYAQQHYDVTPAWVVRYEHRVHYDKTLNAGIGVNYSHQRYDGSASDSVSFTMDVVERF